MDLEEHFKKDKNCGAIQKTESKQSKKKLPESVRNIEGEI